MKLYYCAACGKTGRDGIYRIRLRHTEKEVLLTAEPAAVLEDLEYITGTKDGYLYAVGRYTEGRSYIKSFQADKKNGSLNLIDSQIFNWSGISYMSTDSEEKQLLIAVYGMGRVTAVKIEKGKIGNQSADLVFEGNGPVKSRQESSHPHFAECYDGTLYIADLGADVWYEIRETGLHKDSQNRSKISVMPGSGPRNMAFHPSGKYIYLLTELSNELISYKKGSSNWQILQVLRLVKEEIDKNLSSMLMIGQEGKRIYAGVRGKNRIIEFSVEPTGILKQQRVLNTAGWPRSFCFSEKENLLIAVDEEYKDSKGAVELWDLRTGRRLFYLGLPNALQIYCMDFI